MSRSRIGIAIVVLATLLSSPAMAGLHLRIGAVGVARLALGRIVALARSRHARLDARLGRGQIREAALRPQDLGKAAEAARPPSDPAARRRIAAAAALAGWHDGRIANGWWRHDDGGYGWVGPLFWPFAYDDLTDYILWGDGTSFWDYGYADIYAGIFAPYEHPDLAAYTGPGPSGRRHRRVSSLQELCGDDRRGMAGLPIDQIRQAIQPNEAQRAALDDLAGTLTSAAQMISASCPAQPALTAPDRLAAMQQRLAAMIKGELDVQPPLQRFYDLLDDGQKARFDALAEDRRKQSVPNSAADAPAQGCEATQAAALPWPADEIEARLHPNDTQRAALAVLQQAIARAVDFLNHACQPKDAVTSLARLDAADDRLDAIHQAIILVSDALAGFYATLSDEQKAQFEAIGPTRTT
jgi:hypothetical protein